MTVVNIIRRVLMAKSRRFAVNCGQHFQACLISVTACIRLTKRLTGSFNVGADKSQNIDTQKHVFITRYQFKRLVSLVLAITWKIPRTVDSEKSGKVVYHRDSMNFIYHSIKARNILQIPQSWLGPTHVHLEGIRSNFNYSGTQVDRKLEVRNN